MQSQNLEQFVAHARKSISVYDFVILCDFGSTIDKQSAIDIITIAYRYYSDETYVFYPWQAILKDLTFIDAAVIGSKNRNTTNAYYSIYALSLLPHTRSVDLLLSIVLSNDHENFSRCLAVYGLGIRVNSAPISVIKSIYIDRYPVQIVREEVETCYNDSIVYIEFLLATSGDSIYIDKTCETLNVHSTWQQVLMPMKHYLFAFDLVSTADNFDSWKDRVISYLNSLRKR